MAIIPSVTDSSSSALPKEPTPQSKIKGVIEKGLSDLLETDDIDSQDYEWSLDVEIDSQAIRDLAQFFKEQDSKIPDSKNSNPSVFF